MTHKSGVLSKLFNKKLFKSFPFLLALALTTGTSAHAATYTVDRIDDAAVGSCTASANDCTLRGAINAVSATTVDDTITFSVTGTVRLLTALPDLAPTSSAGKLTIQGPSTGGITLSGDADNSGGPPATGDVHIFNVAAGANVTLDHLTISGGFDNNGSGGINNGGNLTVTNCTFSGNSGGYGGALANTGTVTVTGSTFSGNSAQLGGGLFNSGTATVTGSTFSSNSASFGGGICTGGTFLTTTTPTSLISNSTFSGNTATTLGGGVLNGSSIMTLESCTIAGNRAPQGAGGGVGSGNAGSSSDSTTTNLSNTIVAANLPLTGTDTTAGTDVDNVGQSSSVNTVQSQGHNLIGDGNATAAFNATGDKVIGDADPKLGDLVDNGGPTQTQLPLAGSPALNAGSTTLDTDQRGAPRPTTGADIGSVESFGSLESGNLVVTILADEDDGDYSANDISLREAIKYANAFPGNSTITFASGLTGTIRLLSALPGLAPTSKAGTLTIQGPATSSITISGDADNSGGVGATGDVRVFHVLGGANVTLDHLAIRGGYSSDFGGGVLNSGTLTVSSCTFSGSTADFGGGICSGGNLINGGLAAGGTLTISGSTFSGNTAISYGGGVGGNGSAITVTNSIFADNSAPGPQSGQGTGGGGLCNDGGTLILTGSTFSGNTAEFGGGLSSYTANFGNGETGTPATSSLVRNCTFSGNTASAAGGGVFNYRGLTTLESCTVAGNRAPENRGGGVTSNGDGYATTRLSNTIVAANLPPTGNDATAGTDVDYAPGGTNSFASLGYNLIGDGTSTGAFNATGDQVIGNIDPKLGALANNGGPAQTRLPLAGSPAINTGSTTLPTDQRGAPRPSSNADIGAVEVQGSLEGGNLVVTIPADEDDGDLSANDISLREAIKYANLFSDNSTITFAPGLTGTIRLLSVLPDLETVSSAGKLTIQGPATGGITISGDADNSGGVGAAGDVRVLTVLRGANVTLDRLTVSGGYGSLGGGVRNNGTLAMTNCTVSGNLAELGAGLFNDGGTVTIVGSTFSGNVATSDGGGVATTFGPVTVTGSTFSGNVASDGGGINNFSSPLTFTGCTISRNSATRGGGLFSYTNNFGNGSTGTPASSSVIRNSTFSGNSATSQGGGIFAENGLATLESCTIAGNRAPQNAGGGIASYASSLTTTRLSNTIVAANLPLTGTDASGGTDVDTVVNSSNTFQSLGYNLIGDGNATGAFNATGDQVIGDTDPKLADLSSNGGPTRTRALLPGSPAINAGQTPYTGTLTTDQRGPGFARVRGRRLDIGAFEVQNFAPVATDVTLSGGRNQPFNGQLTAIDIDGDALTYSIIGGMLPPNLTLNPATGLITGTPTAFGTTVVRFKVNDGTADSFTATATIVIGEARSLVVTTLADTTATDGQTSLREAITFANEETAQTGQGDITFASGLTGTITLSRVLPTITSGISITGPGAKLLTITPSQPRANDTFTVASGSVGTFSGLNLTGAASAINNAGVSYVTACSLTGNNIGVTNSGGLVPQACFFGGNIYGIYNGNSSVAIPTNCTFSGNSAAGLGGSGVTVLTNCTLAGNAKGITSQGGVGLSNTVVSGNSIQDIEKLPGGIVADSGHNFIGNNTSVETEFPAGSPAGTSGTSYVGIASAPLISGLAAPADNGGAVKTMAPAPGSLLVNNGDDSEVSTTGPTDGRGPGYPRILGSHIDIGAYEAATLSVAAAPGSSLTFREAVGTNAAILRISRDGNLSQPVTVDLRSSDTTEATIQPSATIAAGASFVDVPVNAVDDDIVDGTQDVSIKPSAAGYVYVKGVLHVTDNDVVTPILSATLSPAAFYENRTGTATTLRITSNRSDVSAAIDIFLSSSDARLRFPNGQTTATATIPAGGRTVTVPLTVIPNPAVTGTANATITVSRAGFISATAAATIYDMQSALAIAVAPGKPSTVSEAAGNGATTVRITRNGPTTAALPLTLAFRDGAGQVTFNTTPTIAAGQSFVDVPVTAVNNTAVDGTRSTTITASATGYLATPSVRLTITDDDRAPTQKTAPTASSVALSSITASAAQGTVTLTFTGALGPTANDVSRYTVTANGSPAIVQSAMLQNSSTVILRAGSLKAGNAIAVTYDLTDAAGPTLKGSAKATAK